MLNCLVTGAYFGCGPLAAIFVERFGARATAFFGCLLAFVGLLIASFMPYFSLVVIFLGLVAGYKKNLPLLSVNLFIHGFCLQGLVVVVRFCLR